MKARNADTLASSAGQGAECGVRERVTHEENARERGARNAHMSASKEGSKQARTHAHVEPRDPRANATVDIGPRPRQPDERLSH